MPLDAAICVGIAWALFLLVIFAIIMWWDNYKS